MSGLSMADMRRIGERRNTQTLDAEPTGGGLLPKLAAALPTFSLPFSGLAESRHTERNSGSALPVTNNKAINRLNRLQQGEPTPSLPPELPAPGLAASAATDVQPATTTAPKTARVTTDPFAEAPTRLSGMSAKQAAAPLRADTNIKAGLGAGLGAALGFAATGTVIAVPAGLIVGGLGGVALAKRAQASAGAAAGGKTISINQKHAAALLMAFEETCMPFGINTPKIALAINQSAALHIASSGKAAKRKLDLTIGLALLAGLSIQQLQALFAQALGCVLATETSNGDPVPAKSVASLDHMQANKSKSAKKPSAKLDALTLHVQSAQFAWSSATINLDRAADARAASIVGSAALVDAILAQGLIAQRFCDDDEDATYQDRIAVLRGGYGQSELNQALQGLAAAKANAQTYLMGMPLQLLDRITALDISVAVPRIPASIPAFDSLDEKLQARLDKAYVGIKAKKVDAKSAKPKKTKPVKAAKKAKPPKAPGTSLFARFTSRTPAFDRTAITSSAEPLYDADAIFKSDAGVGLEAYQSLVDAHPRWALARLRLAEAQIECGQGEGVANLMMAAEQLPSAMPTILRTLQGALPMVSPLEEEPLRQAIEGMWNDADAMSAERAQIDLMRLEAPRMDDADKTTLRELFANVRGLREAWVFNMPCVYVPEVPHHVILGLAPRLPDEDVELLAMQLAEHAAITGTVAVHIETGTPRGGLGDALASQPSLWRVGTH